MDKSVKCSDMCGAFDSLQLPPLESPKGFRRKLKTDLMKILFSSDRADPPACFKNPDVRFAEERLACGFQSVVDVL